MLKKFEICYHGTISDYALKILDNIDITAGRTFTDFGQGYYVTNNLEQASKWALKKYRDHKGINYEILPSVVVMKIDVGKLTLLNGAEFAAPNYSWAEFVYQCRKAGKKGYIYHDYDYVYGPLADGKIVPLLKRLESERINFEQFYRGIMPVFKVNSQLALNTKAAIKCIISTEVKIIHVK